MSQNDPLLGNDWLEKDESISVQLMANGVDISLNDKNIINTKSALISKNLSNNKSINNNINSGEKLNDNHLTANKLMSTITMTESDSSSDDIVIPMQRRKIKHRFSRKRRSRSADSSVSMKSGSLIACPSICLKVVLILTIVGTVGFTLLFMAKLYDRIDSLQIAINDLSLTGNNVPQEMHSIHSHLKQLDSNSSTIRVELNRAFDIMINLTAELKQMKLQLAKISDSVEAAPAIRQLPKELQDLQKVVADLGSRLTTYDNEVKSVKEKQNAQQLQTDSLQSALVLINSNISDLYSNEQHFNNKSFSLKNIESDLEMNRKQMNSLTENLENLHKVYTNLQNWRTDAEEKINTIGNLVHHIHDKLHQTEQHSQQLETNTQISNQTNSTDSTHPSV